VEVNMKIVFALLSVMLAYVLGSLPIGVLAARLVKGVEVRQIGSGRTGATNVYRAAGPWALALTSVGDILKGVFAIWLARILMMFSPAVGTHAALSVWIEALAGVAVIAGHNWSVFLKFRGGAGTVTTVGVLAAMNIYVAGAVVLLGLVAMLASRMASVGSITIALAMGPALAISAAMLITPWPYVLFGMVGGAFTIYALVPNIKRILNGRERQLKPN
jgi:glycerol-3-phosphate acyltransferase PlsY